MSKLEEAKGLHGGGDTGPALSAHAPASAPRAGGAAPDGATSTLQALFEAVVAALEKAGLGDTLDAAAAATAGPRATAASTIGAARATAATAAGTAYTTAASAAELARETAASAVGAARTTVASAADTAYATAAAAAGTARAGAGAAAAAPGRALGAAGAAGGVAGGAARTLSEIAAIVSAMAKGGSLSDLLTHPGHATVGIYYLARRHQMERQVEALDGSHVGDADLVRSLLHYADAADCAYPDRFPDIKLRGVVARDEDVLFHSKEAAKGQPAFYIARDRERRAISWVICGPESTSEALADLAGGSAPLPGGGYAHAGTWQAALWLMDNHLQRALDALAAHPGYGLVLAGHSAGAGVAALVARVLTTNPELIAKLGAAKVEAFCISPPAVVSSDVATQCGDCVTSLVMRYDLVPRFSAHSVEALKRELLELDYRSLLSEDVMAFEAVRKAVDATAAAAQRIKAQERAQAALAQAQGAASKVAAKLASNPQVQQLEKIAQDTAGNLAGKIDAALSPDARGGGGAGGSGTSSGGGDPGTLGRLAAAESAAGRVPLAQDALLALGSKVTAATDAALQNQHVRGALGWVSAILKKAAASGPATAAGAAAGPPAAAAAGAQGGGASGSAGGATATGGGEAAAGVPLYAPGRILWLRPLDEEEPEAEQKFELVDTGCETRFQRIVLRASCVSDHAPSSARAALASVLSRMKAPAGDA